MGGKLISLFSITYAYKAKAILERNDIRCKIASAADNLKSTGCGYGVYVNHSEVNKALIILKRNGIQIKNMY